MTRSTAVRTAALLTVAFAGWQAISRPDPPRDPTSEQIDRGLAAYRRAAAELPASGIIGFIPTTTNEAFNGANHAVAQYALAPRLLLIAFDVQVPFVVTGVDAGEGIDRDPRLTHHTLLAVYDRGVRVYKRSAS
jgi:hypothetical protein